MILFKRVFFLSILFFISFWNTDVLAQCNNASSYGSAIAPTSGSTTISGCQYQTEYSTISNVVNGTTYEVDNSALGCATVTSGSPTGPVVDWGAVPLTWTATSNGTYYIHWNTDCGSCGTATTCTTTSITYISGGGGGGGGGGCGDGVVGGNCANALVVNTMPYQVTGLTTCGAGDCYSSSSACGSSYMNGEDYVLSFTPSATGPFEFVTNGTTTWTGIFVLDGCPDSGGTNCIGSDAQSGGNPNIQNLSLTGGQTYYIVVSTFPSPDCTPFDLTISEEVPAPGCGSNPPAGDLCANAVPICDLTSYCGNTSGAYTASYSPQINSAFCGSIENSSYLSFVADASTVSFDVDVSNCSFNDGVQMMIFDGGCSGAVTNYGCVSPMAPGTTPFTATGLTPGNTYYLIIDGWAGDICDYQIITNNGVLVGANAGPDVSICPGGSTTLSATGGDGTYTWSPGGATTSSINVSPTSTTTYSVTSNIGNPLCGGNTSTDEVIVTVLAGTAPTITGTSVLSGTIGPGSGQTVVICDGGSANLTATGGGTYSWSPSTGLSSGTSATPVATPSSTTTYTVTVDDGNGCIGTATITVQVDPAPTVSVNSGVICEGESLNLTASGASTYSWSPTTGLNPTTGASVVASPITTTNYTVTGSTVGCPDATAVATVTVEPLPTANFTVGGDFCLATNDIDFNNQPAYGASGTYSWTFPGATSTTATDENPSNISWSSAGTYNVTYSVNVNGCESDITLPITINPSPSVIATASDALCFGDLGSVIASSGSSGSSYSWDNGVGSGAGSHDVGAGTYTVTMTDGNGCTATATAIVDVPSQVIVSSSSTDALCFGVCNGTLTGDNASGGTPGYTYSWDGGPSSGSQNQTNVCAGTYTVTATDANGCTATSTETITVPTQLTVSATATDASCNGVCDGTVSTTVAGGTAGYTYAWTGGLTGANPAAVCDGSYTVTVTDANGCTATASATVAEPTLLTVTASGTNLSCNGVCNGTVAAAPAGGTAPYTYSWDNGAGTSATESALCANTYTVTVTDAEGCTATDSYTVTEPVLLTLTVTGNDVSCNGVCDGDATAAAAGGTGVLTYQWDAGGGLGTAATTASTLCAGTAGVTVTDANGCAEIGSVVITEPALLTVTAASVDASCNGVCDGDVTSAGAGGTAPLTYAWSTLGAGQNITGSVCAGTYTVTVTDGNGCTETADATIVEPTLLTVTAASVDASCFGVCDGDVTSLGAGGTAPITYSWGGGLGAGQDFTGSVCAGTYTVTATDAEGCTATATATVAEPTLLAITASGTNASCNGVCDGTTSSVTSGGTAPYTYSWDNGGGTGATASALCANTYTVTVTDAEGCTATASYVVTEPTLLTVAVTGNDASCNAVCDGDATAAEAGGTGPYTYQWDAGGNLETTAATTASLCAGTAGVTVTDAQGCIATGSVAIVEPTALTATNTSTPAACGVSDGTADVTPAGGAGGYTYVWAPAPSTGQGTASVTGLAGGAYTATITDANGCVLVENVTVTNTSAPVASEVMGSHVDVLCFGDATGVAEVTQVGGTPAYTYVWSPAPGGGQGTATGTGLSVGVYSVTITDAGSCSDVVNITITEPTALTAAITGSTDPLCNGVCDGTADVTAAGGTPVYTYSWTSGGTTANETAMCAGTETVTVTDGNGCTTTADVTLVDPALLTAVIAGTDPLCNAGTDGSADLTTTGGTGALTYLWDDPALTTSEDVAGLGAGTYNVTVTDANGCIATEAVTLTEPTAIALTPASVQSTCGQANGEVSVSAVGGTGAFTYLWDDAGASTTASVTGLVAGTYNATVTDANGCTETTTSTITDGAAGTATTVIDNNVSCFGVCDGGATVTVVGGTSPFTYLWNNGETTDAATALCAGTNSVDVTDANGCVISVTADITEPAVLTAAITGSTDPLCNGVCDGTADVTAAGGTPVYTYSWTSGGTTANETAMCAGTETVTVTDGNGCTTTADVTLVDPAVLTAAVVGTDPLCNAGTDGSADLTTTGGTGALTYLWDDGPASTSEDVAGLGAGTYNVTVTDANGCTETDAVTLTEPTAIVLTPSSTDANCGQADGEVCVTAAGGTVALDYVYAWNDAGAQTTACASNIVAGSYDVLVTDDNGCAETANVTISDIAGPTSTASTVLDVSGFGLCDGEVTVSPVGGSGTYTYLWDDPSGQTTQNATGLCAGTYCVTVTDAFTGCTTTACATVAEPGAIILTITTVDLICNGVCIGETDATVSGGVQPYIYSWSSGATAEDLTGLCAGDYTLTVVDDNGISTSQTVTINEPTAVAVTSITGTDLNCNGVCDGTLDVTAAGGTGTLVYTWDGGLPAGQNQTLVCAGTYNVVVTDDNLCTATDVYTINEPDLLVLATSQTDANCSQADGEACVSATGGTAGYTYLWDDPSAQTTLCASTITSGTYNVSVTDANGCIETATVVVDDISGGTATIAIDNNASCNTFCDGQATVTMTGGATPYTYLWDSGAAANSTTNTGLCAGAINVTITDAVGCVTTATETITEPTPLAITSSATDASCNGFADGEVTTIVTGGTAAVDYIYDWVDQATLTNVGNTPTVTGLSIGIYCVTVTDDNGCFISECVTIEEPTPVVVTTAAIDANCGQSDGAVSVATSTGGSGFYATEDWVDGSGNPVANTNAVPAGAYTVMVIDDVGCIGTALAAVSDLSGPTTVLANQVDASCNGYCDGEISVTISGGTAPYTSVWSPLPTAGQGTPDVIGLCAGIYSLNVIDANGCTSSFSTTITEPAPVATSIVSTIDASGASVCDGSADVIAAGGTGTMTYTWFDDCAATVLNGTLTGPNVTGLCADDYAVVSTDANGCADTLCLTIIEPNAIFTTLTGVDVTCSGICDGQATVVASGGIPGFTYQWMSAATGNAIGQTTTTATGLCAGDYFVVVTDANGIVHNSAIQTINEPTVLTGVATVISDYNGFDVSCEGACDGSAEVIPTGGTAPYTYAWDANSGNQTTPIATNLCAITYDVVVTDANGCTQTFSVTLSKPPVLGNVLSFVDVSCNAACDGTITSTPAGGTPPFTYQWNDPALTTTATVADLCAGMYDVVIVDANGCTITESQSITEPVALVLNGSITGSNCNQNDGTAEVTVVTGVAPFTYQWDANAGNQTTAIATNLFAGCYDVTVTDANGCSEILNICVVDLGAPSATILTQTDVTCNSACDGFAQIQVFGGTPPLNYIWYDNNNNPIGQTTAGALNLCAGTYIGEMIDDVGCQATVSVTIEEPTALNAVISASTDVTCFGYADGTATVTASGGTAPYTYAWNDAAAQTTATTTSTLFPGTYTVSVTDANGCVFSVDAIIGEPLEIQLATSFTDAFCETATGSATVTTTNGIAPFTYTWDDALTQGTSTAINLIPNTYTVMVVDADGCIQTTTAIVGDIPPSDVIVTSTTDALCFGDANGTATASVSGTGTAPYHYEWFNASNISQGQDSITATDLPAGDYYVAITDANGCVSSSGITTVNQPILITAGTFVDVDASCSGNCDGEATSTVIGGTFPYTYQWDDALMQTTITAFNLCAQTYNVTIIDANGCSATAPVTISEPTNLVLDSAVVNANCGLPDGNACVIASGGTSPYSYLWPDGSTNSCADNLLAGTYCVLVTDANGCGATICIEVQDLNGPSAMITDTSMVSCNGFNDGSATVDMVGGNGFFTALWDVNAGSQTTPTASNLAAGFYAVTITDSIGCNASISIEIIEPDVMISIQTFYNTVCFGSCDGIASLATIGGTQPYTYNWLDVNNITVGTLDSIGGLCAGDYTLSIADAQGCTDILNYSIGEPDQITGSASSTGISCFGACDGTVTAMGIIGMTPFSYQWGASASNQTGATAFGLCPGNYICTITDAAGCQTTVSAIVTQPTSLEAAINLTGNVSCNGYSDGFAEVSPSGGTAPYTYLWDNGAGSQVTASNLLAGTYTVTVTDANGCVTTATTTITEPTPLALTSTKINVDCFGNCNGSASVIVSGGSGGNTYQWDDPTFGTAAVVNNLCAGIYTCLITDANGCAISETVNITQPTQIGMSVSITDPNCGFDNGSACVNIFGGTIPYVYQWNDVFTQTTACASNLVANCYTVTVIDGSGCIEDSVICLDDIEGPTVTFVTSSDVTCFGDQDGSMQYAVTGGTGSSTLEWIDGVGSPIPAGSNLNSLFGLAGGCYSLTATDAAGCVSSESACIIEPNPLNSAIFNFNDPSCNTGCDGDALVNASGGLVTTDYTYNWNVGQSTQQATGLCEGTYTVTVNDDNNCTSVSSVTISEPTPIVISIDNLQNVSCFGLCDGQIQVSVSGGSAPYLYDWDPLGLTSPAVSGLCAGTYTIRITDANGCVEQIDITITEPSLLVQTASTVNATCSDCNGEGSISVSGGTSPYSYSWFGLGNSPSNSNNTGLCSGLVPFEVTDANGCVVNSTADVIDEAAPVIDSITFVEPLCNGYSTGSATVYTSGGTAPFTYQWDDPAAQTAQTALALQDGLYAIQVSDANSCATLQVVNVTEPSQLVAIADLARTICYGDSTQVWASGQGGTPFPDGSYTVTWDNLPNNGSDPVTVAPLATSQYCATVSDANGCLPVSACVEITVTPPLALTITPPINLCDGGAVNIVATATGGDTLTNPYTFIWYDDAGNSVPSIQSGNISTANVDPTAPTTYYAVITDGCSINDTVSTTVSINPNPQAFIAAFDSSGCAPFTAQFVANSDIGVNFEFDIDCDGTPEYSGPNNTFNYTYTTPGIYDVCLVITSADGCFATVNSTAMITVHDLPVANFGVASAQTSILNPVIEMIDYSIGGSIYAWDFGDGTSIAGNGDSVLVDSINTGIMSDPTHLYSDTGYFDITLTIFSVNGIDTCESVYTQTVHIDGDYIFFAPSAFTPNNDGKNDVFIPKGFGIDAVTYDFYVFNRWGQQIFESHNKDAGWDGKHKGKPVQVDAYVWLVRTIDDKGEAHEYVGHVTVVR